MFTAIAKEVEDWLTFDDQEQLDFFNRFRSTRNILVGRTPFVLRFLLWPLVRILDSALEGYYQIYIAEDKKTREWVEISLLAINLPLLGFHIGWDGLTQMSLSIKLVIAGVLYLTHSHPDTYLWLSEKKIAYPTLHRAIDATIATFIIAVVIRAIQSLF